MNALDYALQYAKQGWAVFPLHSVIDGCCSCKKADCGSPGKHPRALGGSKNATKNLEKIRAWWSQEPLPNIGIATGSKSGLLVIDVDLGAEKEGEESIQSLEDEVGPLPRNIIVLTGGGGYHIYLRMPELPIPSSAGKLGKNLDVRAYGGYVVAPPSSHISGFNYEWSVTYD
ncbi:bifunctional DNA primase/polymerase [uncultured Sulfitobacter sp.]|uniref:bifunctional DNA primase/polymerase n=1 Tax=uncultured Sulfitobacter sp. TaxID=191468 RepID=UPI000C562F2F|nr:hypothetical protein [Sulfitobacter sp.]|tara:strand:+ start:404 stop:919 length:516 start_codon:yes stop_codon:yes gene_type:complete